MNAEEIKAEMIEIMKSKRKNMEWQLEYMRVHFPYLTSEPYEDE
jgi:hypothetical protein